MLVAALLAASLVRLAAAQCTLPVAMPPDTQLAATNPAECVAGAQPPFVSRGLPARRRRFASAARKPVCSVCAGGVISDGGSCEVQCVAGQQQGAGGTYVYTCEGTALTEPTPACAPCPLDTYGDAPGLETCLPCPINSGTDGAVGADEIGRCLCVAGYTGELTGPGSTCDLCAVDTYKETIGSEDCTACVANSGTDGATGSTTVTDCLCDAVRLFRRISLLVASQLTVIR